MEVDTKELVAGVGFLLAQALVVIRVFRRAGQVEEKVNGQSQRLDKHDHDIAEIDNRFIQLRSSFSVELEKAVARLEVRLGNIDRQFITANGEPKYVSYRALDKIRDSCQHHLLSEMGHVRTETAGLREDLNGLVTEMGALIKAVAVLSDRDKRGRFGDHGGGGDPS